MKEVMSLMVVKFYLLCEITFLFFFPSHLRGSGRIKIFFCCFRAFFSPSALLCRAAEVINASQGPLESSLALMNGFGTVNEWSEWEKVMFIMQEVIKSAEL